MVGSDGAAELPPIDVTYQPQGRHRLLPLEVLDRSQVVPRIERRALASRQRVDFHQLVVCTGGSGLHHVDFSPLDMHRGRIVRIFPGQVQQFVAEPWFDAVVVIWPVESHHQDPGLPEWYPGSGVSTNWEVDDELLDRILSWVTELGTEQERFTGDSRQIALMKAMLCALLLRLSIELPDTAEGAARLPAAYVEYRQMIEERLHERPSVIQLARDLGFSSRTVDRACLEVTGLTARQVLDDRLALEVRRLLTHTARPIGQVARDLGFSDPSNFSKFVKRNLGRLPAEIRSDNRLA